MSNFLASEQEMFFFRQQGLWSKDDQLCEKLLFLMSPHGETFHTGLSSFFLFESKSLKHLSYFKNILVRDGLLPLLKFFFEQPRPAAFGQNLLIHEDLSHIVPKQWSQQVYFYRYSDLKSEDKAPPKSVIALGILDETSCPIDLLTRRLEQRNERQAMDCHGLFNLPYPKRENELYDFGGHYIHVMEALREQNFKMFSLNWNRCQNMSLAEIGLLDLNLTKFWYADSYVEHFLRSRGARQIANEGKRSTDKALFSKRLSPHHQIEIHNDWDPKAKKISEIIYTKVEALRDNILSKEQTYPKSEDEESEVKLCSPELSRLALSIIHGKFDS